MHYAPLFLLFAFGYTGRCSPDCSTHVLEYINLLTSQSIDIEKFSEEGGHQQVVSVLRLHLCYLEPATQDWCWPTHPVVCSMLAVAVMHIILGHQKLQHILVPRPFEQKAVAECRMLLVLFF